MGKRNGEIRESRKARVLGALGGWLMWVWGATLRYEVTDHSSLKRGLPTIYVLWHSRIFSIPLIWRRTLGKERQAVVLTSASHDGAMLARAMRVFGLGSIRGSSSRRGVAALIGLRRTLESGVDVCITPDGPRGPRYEVQPGVVKVAEFSGAKVVPVHARYGSAWRLGTWDRLVLPKPFSKVWVTFGETLAVPRGLDETAFEATRAAIEKVLRDGADDL